MNIQTTLKFAFVASALAMSNCAVVQESSVTDKSSAARERRVQAPEPEAVKAIFAKAEDVAKNRAWNFCGFHLGMSADEAKTLAAYYGLKDDQWNCLVTPKSKRVYRLAITLPGVRRITKCGSSFGEMLKAVGDQLGPRGIDGQRVSMYKDKGFILKYEGLAKKSVGELFEAELKEVAETKAVLAELASEMEMVSIPGKDYSICKYEVTQALWVALMGENPSDFEGADRPVENVSWNDCQKFLEKLNALPEVKESGRAYRLPTADEWEFACRAGASGKYCKLADGKEITERTLRKVAWYGGNSKVDGKRQTHSVGQKKPNAFGLYDMHGNVWEWTCTDKTTTEGKNARVLCGGSWSAFDSFCGVGGTAGIGAGSWNAGDHYSYPPDYRRNDLGFRLCSDK